MSDVANKFDEVNGYAWWNIEHLRFVHGDEVADALHTAYRSMCITALESLEELTDKAAFDVVEDIYHEHFESFWKGVSQEERDRICENV